MVGKGILLGDERVEDVPRDARGNPARRQGAGQGEGGLRGQQGRNPRQHGEWKGETKGQNP